MRNRTLRTILWAALVATVPSAYAQDPDQHQEPAEQPSPSPSPSPSVEPSPAPTPVPTPAAAATPAPAPSPPKAIRAMVKAVPARRVFVGDEPVTVVYHLVAATGVAIDPSPLLKPTGPFRVLSAVVGERVGIPGAKDLHVQRVTLEVRFPADAPLGPHRIPGATLNHSQEIVVEKDGFLYRNPTSGTVAVPLVQVEKVAAYAQTDLLHETTMLGDRNAATITVHLGPEAELLNERLAPGAPAAAGVTYLSTFKPAEPFVLLDVSGRTDGSGTYRLVTYTYGFSTLDIGPKPFPFAFPPVQYRRTDSTESRIIGIAPATTGVLIRPRVDRKTPAEPAKGPLPDPVRERFVLKTLPEATVALLGVTLAGLVVSSVVGWLRTRKDRKRRRPATDSREPDVIEPVFESRWYHGFILGRRASAALKAYNAAPDHDACVRLAGAVSRLLASHCGNIDRDRAQTMPSTEFPLVLAHHYGRWLRVLEGAQRNLETTTYGRIGR